MYYYVLGSNVSQLHFSLRLDSSGDPIFSSENVVTVLITTGHVEHRVLGQCSLTRISGSEISDTATLFRCGREKKKKSRQQCSRGHLPCWLTESVSISPPGPFLVKLYSLHLVTHPRRKYPLLPLPPPHSFLLASNLQLFLNVSTLTREFFVVGDYPVHWRMSHSILSPPTRF